MANQSAERETGRQFTSRERLDACFAWRAMPSFLIVYAGRLLVKKFTLPSPSLALDQGGNPRHNRVAAQSAVSPFGFRWTLHVFPPWSSARWLRAPTTAARHTLLPLGRALRSKEFVCAWAHPSLLGCHSGRVSILSTLA